MKMRYALVIDRPDGGFEVLTYDGMAMLFDYLADARRERGICAHPENIRIIKWKRVEE